DGGQGPNTTVHTPLFEAVQSGHRIVVSLLLAHKANANGRVGASFTPLQIAAAKGYKAVAELLIEYGADEKAVTPTISSYDQKRYSKGTTLLHMAAANDQSAMIDWLCARGADVNAKDEQGDTP
ncbi:MAG: hypothetical protein DME26_01190, partial [Verrucomicrobia bacterium]